MKMRCVVLAAAVGLAAGAACWAFDTVKTTSGTVSGTVVSMNPLEVVVEQNALRKPVAVNEIVTVFYDDEPTQLRTARTHLLTGRYEDALASLENVDPSAVSRLVVKQDIAFFKALCAAKIALGGGGSISDAGRQMMAFVTTHKGSYHYFEACEAVGDLLVALRKYPNAEEYYSRLARDAPWPDYKMRAGVALGRARLAQNKVAEAKRTFETVLGMDADSDLARAQHLAASLGKATCLASEGQHDQAIKTVAAILEKADPEDIELHARAYNTLGNAYRKAGRDKEALMAFLHVDVLYFTVPECHAEALANLAELWTKVHKAERAVRARRILDERYKNSPWAKQGGDG